MACDVCECEDHPHKPCPHCLNCIGHHTIHSDYDQDHSDETVTSTESMEHSQHVGPKPHYVYNARTGVLQPKNHTVQKIVE